MYLYTMSWFKIGWTATTWHMMLITHGKKTGNKYYILIYIYFSLGSLMSPIRSTDQSMRSLRSWEVAVCWQLLLPWWCCRCLGDGATNNQSRAGMIWTGEEESEYGGEEKYKFSWIMYFHTGRLYFHQRVGGVQLFVWRISWKSLGSLALKISSDSLGHLSDA